MSGILPTQPHHYVRLLLNEFARRVLFHMTSFALMIRNPSIRSEYRSKITNKSQYEQRNDLEKAVRFLVFPFSFFYDNMVDKKIEL